MANIQILANKMKSHNRYLYDVGQGVDLDSYIPQKAMTPEDIRGIPRPIVGYTGTIVTPRLDAELLYNVAKALPEVSFVMVGPEDDGFVSHRVHDLNNIYFLGHKPTTTMPDYISSFDVCINPQKVNEITIGNYPRKIDEYLAMGKPTVATKTEAMDMFKDFVECCENEQQWIFTIKNLVSKSQNQEDITKRIEFAHTHSWENSVEKIYKYIDEVKQLKEIKR